jgi:hypothetical protein
MDAIDLIEKLPNKDLHGFCYESPDQRINISEMAAFLGNMQQETGDPSSIAPYPYDCPYNGVPKCVKMAARCGGKLNDGSPYTGPTNCCFTNATCKGTEWWASCTANNPNDAPEGGRYAGGAQFLVEGALEQVGNPSPTATSPPNPTATSPPISQFFFNYDINNKNVEDELGCSSLGLSGGVVKPNTNRGLFFSNGKFQETDGGCVMQGGYTCVTSDGTLYGNKDYVDLQTSQYKNLFPVKTLPDTCNSGDGTCQCVDLDLRCEYVGRGPTQLTGNINYHACSLALFGDLRLVKYPNLLNTIDRTAVENNGGPYYSNEDKTHLFGFPGSTIPPEILNSTPDARILIWATNLWFWMDRCRSGKTLSCHQSMLDPANFGISAVGCIVNGNPACPKQQTLKKYVFYQNICNLFGIQFYEAICNDAFMRCELPNSLGNKC